MLIPHFEGGFAIIVDPNLRENKITRKWRWYVSITALTSMPRLKAPPEKATPSYLIVIYLVI
jgi:hypothetical protein